MRRSGHAVVNPGPISGLLDCACDNPGASRIPAFYRWEESMKTIYTMLLLASLGFGAISTGSAIAQETGGPGTMTFFVTSTGLGNGADLGGVEGADRHCQSLAQAAGAGSKTWRAYLSTQAAGGAPRSMHATGSAGDHGKMQRASSSPKTSRNCTARTISPSRRTSPNGARSSMGAATRRTSMTC